MSFIHDALKKAQQRKDSSYANYENLISGPREPVRGKKRRLSKWVIVPAALVVLVFAAIIIYQESSGINFSARKGSGDKSKAAEPAPAPVVQPQAPPVDTEALYQEALKNQLTNDSARAETLYRQIIAARPDHVDALNNLGVILMSAGKSEGKSEEKSEEKSEAAVKEAIDMFNKAISLKPDFADAYYNLACSYAKLQKVEDGLKFLEQAIMIKPELAAFAARDGDLQNLRSSAKFKQVINKK